MLMKELVDNPLLWGKVYMPDHFKKPSPWFHYKMLAEQAKHRFFACGSPRESAKTEILNFLSNMHDICYKKCRFILLVQNTENKARETLDSIKSEIDENQLLRAEYGLKVTKDTKDDSIIMHPDGWKTRVLCKGKEQMGSIRGVKFGTYRPDRIKVDDLEDDKMCKNPELRAEIQDQFDQILIPAGQQDICRYTVVGTIFHDDSLMSKLVSLRFYENWKKLLFRALNIGEDGKYKSLWPEVWTVEKLIKMSKTHPSVFAMEYQNNPVSGLLSSFDRKDWRYIVSAPFCLFKIPFHELL